MAPTNSFDWLTGTSLPASGLRDSRRILLRPIASTPFVPINPQFVQQSVPMSRLPTHSPICFDVKCVERPTPVPSMFQGDLEKAATAKVPDVSALANYPTSLQRFDLPRGWASCIMCGHICLIGKKRKTKKPTTYAQAHQAEEACARTIASQNKSVCTECDVKVWVLVASGLEIKWCMGCKNFRPWAAFGEKGYATKCEPCRVRQRELYRAKQEQKKLQQLLESEKGSTE